VTAAAKEVVPASGSMAVEKVVAKELVVELEVETAAGVVAVEVTAAETV
jgi:hypothetical protein